MAHYIGLSNKEQGYWMRTVDDVLRFVLSSSFDGTKLTALPHRHRYDDRFIGHLISGEDPPQPFPCIEVDLQPTWVYDASALILGRYVAYESGSQDVGEWCMSDGSFLDR